MESKNKSGKLKFAIGWIFFSVCLISLLAYGLSFFISEPTVETITTDSAEFSNSNSTSRDLMRDIKFKSKERLFHKN